MKIIKNILAIPLVIYGSYLILFYMKYVNMAVNMGGPLSIITNDMFGFLAVLFGTVYLLIGKKLLSFPLHWIFRVLFVVSCFFIIKNIWLYSFVPFDVLLHDGRNTYPTIWQDIIAVLFLGIFFMNSSPKLFWKESKKNPYLFFKVIMILALNLVIVWIISTMQTVLLGIYILLLIYLAHSIEKMSWLRVFKSSFFIFFVLLFDDFFMYDSRYISHIFLIVISLILYFKNNDYKQYFFIVLISYEILNIMGRGTHGDFFSFINMGTITILFTLLFYNTYLLSKKYLKIKNYTSSIFALSMALTGLSSILYDLENAFQEFLIVENYILELGLNLQVLTFMSIFMGVGLFFYFMAILMKNIGVSKDEKKWI